MSSQEFNIGKPFIRVENFVKGRECDTCGDGVLLGFRDQATLLFINWDHCVGCGQRYIYEHLTEQQNLFNAWTISGSDVSDGSVRRIATITHELGVELPEYLKQYLAIKGYKAYLQTDEFKANVNAIKAKLARTYSPKK